MLRPATASKYADKNSMVLNVLGYWGFGLSGYGLGFTLGLGSKGLWIGQSAAIAVVAALFLWRLRSSSVQCKLRSN